MATSLGRLVLDMAADAAGFERDMQRVSKSAKKELGKVNRELWKAERDLDRARGKVNRLAGAMGALGAVAIAGVGREFRKFAQEANSLDKVSKTVSLTVEELQELRFAAEQAAGVTSQTLDMAMQRFSRRVGEAANDTGELNTVVKELGVQLRNQDGSVKSQTELLRVFANEIQNAGSEQEQLRIAFKLFDSEGARMVTLMRQGGDALQEYIEQARRAGGIMSSETVEATVRFNDALNILSENIKGLRNQFFGGLIGPLADYAEILATTEQGQAEFNAILTRIANTAKVAGVVIGTVFTATLLKAIAQMLVAEVRVGSLTARMHQLTGATGRSAAALTFFGRAVSLATGPIGIAIGVIGTLAFSMREIQVEGEATEDVIARVTGSIKQMERAAINANLRTLERKLEELNAAAADAQFGTFLSGPDPEEAERIQREIGQVVDAIGLARGQLKDIEEGWADFGGAQVDAIEMGLDAWKRYSKQSEKSGEEFDNLSSQADTFLRKIEDISDELAGDNARANREFQRAMRDAVRLVSQGAISQEEYNSAVEVLSERWAEATEEGDELNRTLEDIADHIRNGDPELRAYADGFRQIAAATLEALTGMDMLGEGMGRVAGTGEANDAGGRLASAMSSALSVRDGQNLGDSIGNALRAHGTQGISEGLQDAMSEAMQDLGIEADSGALSVATLAVGEAIGGNMGSAIGTVLGGIVGAFFGGNVQAGAAIGGAIGGLFNSDGNDPRFDFGGFNAMGDARPNEGLGVFNTVLTERVGFARKHIKDQAVQDIIKGIREFDRALAQAIEGTGMSGEVTDALADFVFQSGREGMSLEEMMQARFDAALKAFDGFIQAMVMRGDTLEDQLQRLQSAFFIQREMRLGGDLGLEASVRMVPVFNDDEMSDEIREELINAGIGFNRTQVGEREVDVSPLENTILLVEELSGANETLAETYQRLVSSTRSLDEIFGVIPGRFRGSREELIRFGDALTEAFGGDVDRLTEGLSRIAETFFGEDAVIEQQIAMMRDRAESMLASLDIDNIDHAMTEQGFARIFERMFGRLGAEDAAVLIEAGNTIADIIDLEAELAEEREKAAERLSDFMDEVDMAFLEATQPAMASLKRLTDRWSDMEEEAIELGASEDQLRLVRRAANAELKRWVSDMKLSTLQLAEDFFSVEQSFEQTGTAVSNTARNMRDQVMRALGSIDEWLMSSQLDSNSPLTPQQRLGEAEAQFQNAFQAAMSGDADALESLPNLADQFLGEAGGFFGTSTDQFRQIWDQVRSMMNEAADIEPPPEQQPVNAAQMNTLIETNSRFGSQIDELNREMQAWQLGDQINALAIAQEKTPAEIAAALGFTDSDMRQILGALGEDIPSGTEITLRDHFNDVVGEIAEQNPIVKAMKDSNDDMASMLGAIEASLWSIGDVLVQILEQLGGEYDPFQIPTMHSGGPVESDGLHNLQAGEYVVPRGGRLVSETSSQDFTEVKQELNRISRHLERGNTDRREGLGAMVEEERSTRRSINRKQQTVRAA